MPTLAEIVVALLAVLQPPIDSGTEPIDSNAVVAGINAVLADNPSHDYAWTGIAECPFGNMVALVGPLAQVYPLDPALLDGRSEAWSVPSAAQPHISCSIESERAQQLKPPGIAHVEVYAKLLRDQPYVGPDWNEAWARSRQSQRPYRGGIVVVVCLTNDQQWAAGQRHCMAHFVDESAGLSLEFEIWSYDGSATAAKARATLHALLPAVVAALSEYPSSAAT